MTKGLNMRYYSKLCHWCIWCLRVSTLGLAAHFGPCICWLTMTFKTFTIGLVSCLCTKLSMPSGIRSFQVSETDSSENLETPYKALLNMVFPSVGKEANQPPPGGLGDQWSWSLDHGAQVASHRCLSQVIWQRTLVVVARVCFTFLKAWLPSTG